MDRPHFEKLTVSQAFALYVDKIAFDDQRQKDVDQRRNWLKSKKTSIDYFISQVGDIPLDEITRETALRYEDWWRERIKGQQEGINPPVKPNTANRHIGNMRGLYKAYYQYIGDEDRRNPFRNMSFKLNTKSNVATFEDDWVRERIKLPILTHRSVKRRGIKFSLPLA